MFRHIAVTTDFSDASRQAFVAAGSLARKFEATLHVIHVAQAPQIFTVWQIPSEKPPEERLRVAALQWKLDELIRRETSFERVKVEPHVLRGDFAEAIQALVDEQGIELIVIATHGYWGVKHFLLGSFAAKVLRAASTPVLVFRHIVGGREAEKERFQPRRILVPYDFSPISKGALTTAHAWALAYEATVRLFHVVDPQVQPEAETKVPVESASDYYRFLEESATRELEKVSDRGWGDVASSAAARAGNPATEIVKEATDLHTDLIIMGSRGLSLRDPLSVGSIAERTIQGAPCPVLVVKSDVLVARPAS